MKTLYPEIRSYARHRLRVDAPHEIYFEESGDPKGLPVLFVHGGPGSGCSKRNRQFFDPEIYRIILFDQRGSGCSTPHAELTNNTTQDLLGDIEAIREYLGIDKWVLLGGSWGTTLSLLYAQRHSERVLGLILCGVFLCRDTDIQWFYQDGANHIFPDHWQDFLNPVAPNQRENLVAAYYQLLTGDNELARMSAAKSWSQWEANCATLRPNHELLDLFSDPHIALARARVGAHYFYNQGFISPNQILNNVHQLSSIGGIIIHGRYDMVCRLDNAVDLHNAWLGSELQIIRGAGHSSLEPSIIDALVRATCDMAKRFT